MSDLTLIIGNKNYSSWSLRPWLFMKHAGIEFKEKHIALYTATSREELSPYFSNFKVPALKDGDFMVWDSLSILEYIADKYPNSKGWPDDPKARAFARSVSAEMHSSFVALRSELPMNCRREITGVKLSGKAQADIERIKDLWRACRNGYGSDREWLFGQFSIADAMYAPVALRFSGYSIPLTGIESSYVQSVLSHPAVAEWVEAGTLEKEVITDNEIGGNII